MPCKEQWCPKVYDRQSHLTVNPAPLTANGQAKVNPGRSIPMASSL